MSILTINGKYETILHFDDLKDFVDPDVWDLIQEKISSFEEKISELMAEIDQLEDENINLKNENLQFDSHLAELEEDYI